MPKVVKNKGPFVISDAYTSPGMDKRHPRSWPEIGLLESLRPATPHPWTIPATRSASGRLHSIVHFWAPAPFASWLPCAVDPLVRSTARPYRPLVPHALQAGFRRPGDLTAL